MGKKTDGRSWLQTKHRTILTEYRDSLRELVINEEDTTSKDYLLASARYLEASQAISRLLSTLGWEVRSLKTKLTWAERRTKEALRRPRGKPFD